MESLLLTVCLALAQDWREPARKRGFSEEDVAALARDRVLATADVYKQIFDPYVASDMPVFVTSDSVLNAFHVLLEESVAQAEIPGARRFAAELRRVRQALDKIDAAFQGDARLLEAGRTRARIVLEVAIGLLEAEPSSADPIVRTEIERVRRSEGRLKPEWLGPPDPGFVAIDYTRFKPRGFYERSELLQRHFRALSWLQAVPFRIGRDEEVAAILALAKASGRGLDIPGTGGFLGLRDDWDLSHVIKSVHEERIDLGAAALAERRRDMRPDSSLVNDQLRFHGGEPAFRVISARRTPDAVLFQKLSEDRPFPSGLHVAAALGSTAAQGLIDPASAKGVAACSPLFADTTLYAEYLRCLSALLDAPEPDAPAFLAGRAWELKSCETALAGWAQLRHTWTLQAKRSEYYLGMTSTSPGFVEPDPEFFARLGRLAVRVADWLETAEAFKPDPLDAAEDVRKLLAVLEKGGFAKRGARAADGLEPADAQFLDRQSYLWAVETPDSNMWKPEYYAEAIKVLRAELPALEAGRLPAHERLSGVVQGSRGHLRRLWGGLSELGFRLEALAHKQLRGAEWTEAESDFLRGYGATLARLLLYAGNSYLSPNDDAPRVADVHGALGKSLQAGVGRPRALFVLYPWKGKDILCLGAVRPYYEFVHEGRMTDVEWKTRLDTDPPARLPALRAIESATRTSGPR